MGQHRLHEIVGIKSTSKALLFGFVKMLSQEKQYLGTIISNPISLNNNQLIFEKLF